MAEHGSGVAEDWSIIDNLCATPPIEIHGISNNANLGRVRPRANLIPDEGSACRNDVARAEHTFESGQPLADAPPGHVGEARGQIPPPIVNIHDNHLAGIASDLDDPGP